MKWDKLRQDWVLAVLLLMVTALAYSPAWTGKPIWDDDGHLTKPELRSWSGLARIWFKPGATQQYYPVVHSVFWVEHKIWGDATLGYHLVNILLHVGGALLLLKILQKLQVRVAWLAVAIFALHPVQVESVAWITELKNTLSGVFYFSAALACLRFDQTRSRRDYALGLALFIAGLMSKSVIATMPAALLVVYWWKRGRLSWRNDVVPLLPFFVIGAASGLFTAWMERHEIGAEGMEFHFTIADRILIAGRALWFYLGKLLCPVDLTFSYSRWHIDQRAGWQYLFPAGYILLLVVLWCWRKRNRGPLAAMLYFAGTLFPALGFLNVFPFRYSFVADHFQYLACIGPIVLVATAFELAIDRTGWWSRILRPLVWSIWLAALVTLTWFQSHIYTDVETLWLATLDRNPKSWLAHSNLGAHLLAAGDLDEALDHLQKAEAIDPYSSNTHNNIGLIYAQRGRLIEAIAEYQKALDIDPKMVIAHINLGAALMAEDRLDEAISQFQNAIDIQPASAGAHSDLAIAFARKGLLTEAISEFRSALQFDPNNPQTHKDFARVLAQQGETKQAVEQYHKTLQLDPNNIEALDRLAWLLATSSEDSLRDGNQAVELAQHANAITGNQNTTILRTLAASLAEAGKLDDAKATARKALDLARAASQHDLVKQLESDLKQYEAGRPVRQ